ncbi:uncharacterized protein LOC116665817 isoform X3 [Camelus ferus]|uniref:Uncharacterized protein LOC116665817 isoform X3 n=1 Tax=Camelus ferus TaxID=419612 RepID=A0A8B8TKD5_CAMFR|nr:uncharacterized protein LOC116665817 isoform X3 [Camelus ferus]
MRVEWSPDPEKMLNGQSPLPIGVPCAGWSACGTRLLRREAGLSDVGSIPGSLGIQPGEGLAASGRRKARAAYMLMAQRGEAICHVMRQMKRVSRQKTRSAKSQLLFWREVNVLWNFNNGCLETKQRSPLQMRNTRPGTRQRSGRADFGKRPHPCFPRIPSAGSGASGLHHRGHQKRSRRKLIFIYPLW